MSSEEETRMRTLHQSSLSMVRELGCLGAKQEEAARCKVDPAVMYTPARGGADIPSTCRLVLSDSGSIAACGQSDEQGRLEVALIDVQSLCVQKLVPAQRIGGYYHSTIYWNSSPRLRDMCFVGDEHLIFGVSSGDIERLRVSDGEWDTLHLGGHVEGLASGCGFVAASVMPACDGHHEESTLSELLLIDQESFVRDMACLRDGPVVGLEGTPFGLDFLEGGLFTRGVIGRTDGRNTSFSDYVDLDTRSVQHLFFRAGSSASCGTRGDRVVHTLSGQVSDYHLEDGQLHLAQTFSPGYMTPKLRPGSSEVFGLSDGKIYFCDFEAEKVKLISESLPRVAHAEFINEREMLCVLDHGDRQELCKFDVLDRCITQYQLRSGLIRPIAAHTLGVDGGGSFYVGTLNDQVHHLDSGLRHQGRIELRHGPARCVCGSPHEERFAICSGNGALAESGPSREVSAPKSRDENAPDYQPGSGAEKVQFRPDGAFHHSSYLQNRHGWTSETEVLALTSGGRRLTSWKAEHGATKNLSALRSQVQLLDLCSVEHQLIGLTAEGALVQLEAPLPQDDLSPPYPFASDSDFHELLDGSVFEGAQHIVTTDQGSALLAGPSGCCWLVEVNEAGGKLLRSAKLPEGISGAQWSPSHQSFVVQYPNYASLVDLRLCERVRFYIVEGCSEEGDSALVHALFTPHAQPAGADPHPGFFAAEGYRGGVAALLSIQTAKGLEVTSAPRRARFVADHLQPQLVELSITNPKAFDRICERISYGKAPSLTLPKLLPANRNPKHNRGTP